ncbi:pilus assembly protein [Loktanella sp. IMCC34160]|uniref:TadE/TadG family type IV pilus assembly protein n=1 Tax=Loktanella sp. IMCC34160 TaxID=2510646 RepID=UPI00101BA319|nr:TadE/TadG family type IV pilus assembly protein [Loktanella sp. IMCC34160]RYG93166.1 pilus assembly protein [Loktanella sp. IMCC34160]
MIRRIFNLFRVFRRGEDGTASVEFVLVFPAFMILFVSAFELGLMMTRHAMLERALDMTIREIRLNTAVTPTHDQVKRMICNGAGIIPNCMESLKLEMIVLNPRDWADFNTRADCVDVDQPFAPVRSFSSGQQNQLMVLRACSLFSPIFPTTGIGYHIPRQSGDQYALVSLSAFVMEPL